MDLSVKSIQENWNKKSTAQKVGTVAAGVVGVAAVASAVVAGVKGKKIVTDEFVKGLGLKNGENAIEKASDLKFFKKAGLILGEGYKKIGGEIKDGAINAYNAVKKFLNKKGGEGTPAPTDAQ